MIQLGQSSRPYGGLEGMGDFFLHIVREADDLIVVGDVGGHGQRIVGQAAEAVKHAVKDNADLAIDELMAMVAQMRHIKTLGLALFVGCIPKGTPILMYQCVGNLLLFLQRGDRVIELSRQEGLLGLAAPENISSKAIKLVDNDHLFISSDGIVKAVKQNFLDCLDGRDLPGAAEKILADYGKPNDDAMCMVVRFIKSGAGLGTSYTVPSKERAKTRRTETALVSDKPAPASASVKPSGDKSDREYRELLSAQKLTSFDDQFRIYSIANSDEMQLDEQDLFASLHYSPLTAERLVALVDYLVRDARLKVKILTVVLEVIKNIDTQVNVYVNDRFVWFRFSAQKTLAKQLFPLFGRGVFFYSENEQACVIRLLLDHDVDTGSEEFSEIREMVRFGLNKDSYRNFKDHQKKDSLINQQAKLASMGEMIGAIAHQWRQPLNEIAIRVQQLHYFYARNRVDENYVEDFVSTNLNTIDFMSRTIDDFRNFFRVDKERELFSIKDAVSGVLSLQEAQLKKYEIAVEFESDNYQFLGYKSELQQVILNLLSNAKDAFEEQGSEERKIRIMCSEGTISVEDNAGGMPDAVAQRIFEPYFTTKDHAKGTGVGLYICKTIVEKNLHGKLSYTAVENGSKFTIQFAEQ